MSDPGPWAVILPGWERRSIYGWIEREHSWYAQLWRNDLPDDKVADRPHVAFGGDLNRQTIGDISLLIQLIATATGYPFDVVDQVLLLEPARHGTRLRISIPGQPDKKGTAVCTLPVEQQREILARGEELGVLELACDDGTMIDVYDLAMRIGRGEARIERLATGQATG